MAKEVLATFKSNLVAAGKAGKNDSDWWFEMVAKEEWAKPYLR